MAMQPLILPFGPFNNQFWGTAAPSGGGTDWPDFQVGDIMWNTAPSAGNPAFWMCSVAPASKGASGTWVATANMV